MAGRKLINGVSDETIDSSIPDADLYVCNRLNPSRL